MKKTLAIIIAVMMVSALVMGLAISANAGSSHPTYVIKMNTSAEPATDKRYINTYYNCLVNGDEFPDDESDYAEKTDFTNAMGYFVRLMDGWDETKYSFPTFELPPDDGYGAGANSVADGAWASFKNYSADEDTKGVDSVEVGTVVAAIDAYVNSLSTEEKALAADEIAAYQEFANYLAGLTDNIAKNEIPIGIEKMPADLKNYYNAIKSAVENPGTADFIVVPFIVATLASAAGAVALKKKAN